MADNVRESDLVLSQNEFAYILDTNTGRITTFTGPFKTTIKGTDQPVRYDETNKSFVKCNTSQSISKMIFADERSYIVLQNPAYKEKDGVSKIEFPTNSENSQIQLQYGKSINIQGPATFPIWPGQVAKVIPGHQLRSNQYLLVQVVNAEEAKKNWDKFTIETADKKDSESETISVETTKTRSEFKFITGCLNIIRGTEVSFYIPPTGVEVLYDTESNSYQRDAETIERLQYCILIDESGDKEYVKGPSVVFPKPTQKFMTRGKSSDNKKFKALELNKDMGIYIKVISDYSDTVDGKKVTYSAGDELFITGKDQKIYFPRPEHAVITYEGQTLHYAIVIPEGEARYALNKMTGQIETIKGPTMYLPDPRNTVIIKRVLDAKTVGLWFPNNDEALKHNLNAMSQEKNELGFVEADRSAKYSRNKVAGDYSTSTLRFFDSNNSNLDDFEVVQNDSMSRKNTFTPPRTIQINNKYDGAVLINIWPGYAIQTVSRTGKREVIVGPKAVVLDYNQTLEVLKLSAGCPKSTRSPIETVYLKVKDNKVSDEISVETKDLVNVSIKLSYLVNFEDKDSQKWFNIQDYIKFMTDHIRSIIRNEVKKYGVEEFHSKSTDIIRNIILGEKVQDKNRAGLYFSENGMRITDVDVLGIRIDDQKISELLIQGQHYSVQCALTLKRENDELEVIRKIEESKQAKLDLYAKTKEKESSITKDTLERDKVINGIRNEIEEIQVQFRDSMENVKLERSKLTDAQEIAKITKKTEIATEAYQKRMASINDKLIAAINSLGDKQLATELVKNLPHATGTSGFLFGTGGMEGLNKLISGSTILEDKLGKHLSKLNSKDGEGLIEE